MKQEYKLAEPASVVKLKIWLCFHVFFLATKTKLPALAVFSLFHSFIFHHIKFLQKIVIIYKTCLSFPKCLLHFFSTVITGSMVSEWLVLPPHSKVPLFESWTWSSEWGVYMVWLCLCQFPTTPKCCLFQASCGTQTINLSWNEHNHWTEWKNTKFCSWHMVGGTRYGLLTCITNIF